MLGNKQNTECESEKSHNFFLAQRSIKSKAYFEFQLDYFKPKAIPYSKSPSSASLDKSLDMPLMNKSLNLPKEKNYNSKLGPKASLLKTPRKEFVACKVNKGG